MIRDIFFNRHNHSLRVHGYRENGDITTPFDMRVMSELDRFHLAQDAANAALGKKHPHLQLKWMKQLPSTMLISVKTEMTFGSAQLEMENVNK